MFKNDLIIVPKEKIQDADLHRYISKILGTELTNINTPCYKPKLVKYWPDLMKKSNITEDMIREFKKRLDKKYQTGFSILRDNYAILLLMLVLYFSRYSNLNRCQ